MIRSRNTLRFGYAGIALGLAVGCAGSGSSPEDVAGTDSSGAPLHRLVQQHR
jgi:hypothetical protein